jgi:hypothetical protein
MHDFAEEEALSLISDYEEDFGVKILIEDARRMLVLYGELCEIFEKYRGDGPQDELAGLLES